MTKGVKDGMGDEQALVCECGQKLRHAGWLLCLELGLNVRGVPPAAVPEATPEGISMPTSEAAETDLLVKLLREQDRCTKRGWLVSADLSDVPEGIGHYSVDDGLEFRGAGVTHNMHRAVALMISGRTIKRPIFMWLPDADGSADLWLDGRIRCKKCGVICEISGLDRHGIDVHDEEDFDEDE